MRPAGLRRAGAGALVRFVPIAAVAALSLAGCASEEPAGGGVAGSRDTLPDGTVVVRYPALPIGDVLVAPEEARLGTVGDDPNLSFGDVRGIDAGSDGTIYVLDYQASEVRAFDAEGRFLRLVASEGEGPGEISEANGMILVGDSLLWIQDHGKMMMIAVSTSGEERTRVPMPVRAYGYMWNGTVDHAGRVWKPASHSDEEPAFPPELGFNEGTSRGYLKQYDPATQAADSIYLGESTYRSYVARNSRGGYTHRAVPFMSGRLTVVDPDGGFWTVENAAYRVARLDTRGDTILVIESGEAPPPVTEADRTSYVEEGLEYDADAREVLEEIAAAMPETKPVIAGLVVDDVGRLWVSRVVPAEETPLYDVFDREGSYLGSVRLGFSPNRYLPIRIRDGRLYALVQDELDIPFVVRAPVPPEIGAVTPTESAAR